jgi:hypothetical protein
MGQIWAAIKLIQQVISIFKVVMNFVIDWRKSQLDSQYQKEQIALDKLKQSQTKEEVKDAVKDVAKNSF